jgi:hypothetical protein
LFPERNKKITEKTLTPKDRRNLILLTKILQNLANQVKFGIKEEFLSCMNEILDEYQTKTNEYLLNVCASRKEAKEHIIEQQNKVRIAVRDRVISSKYIEDVQDIQRFDFNLMKDI